MGAPGSGKGTQAEKLMDEFNCRQISTGVLLRQAIESGSELGKKVQKIMSEGLLVSDDIVLDLIKNELSEIGESGFLLDGYPRNKNQAKSLDDLLENINKPLLYISGETISVDLDRQLINEGYNIKRIINYRTIHNQKFDQNFIKELRLNMPNIVYVYSPNSASSFLNFIKIHQTENEWMNTNLMCIGEKTSSILNEIKWKKIFLFNPGEEEFLLYKI